MDECESEINKKECKIEIGYRDYVINFAQNLFLKRKRNLKALLFKFSQRLMIKIQIKVHWLLCQIKVFILLNGYSRLCMT